jgi:hypothetical protein
LAVLVSLAFLFLFLLPWVKFKIRNYWKHIQNILENYV